MGSCLSLSVNNHVKPNCIKETPNSINKIPHFTNETPNSTIVDPNFVDGKLKKEIMENKTATETITTNISTIYHQNLCQSFPLFSLENGVYFAYCVSVYDGDTVTLNIQTDIGIHKWKIRLSELDAPELKTHNLEEKKHGKTCCELMKYVLLNRYCIIQCGKFDKYGRLLGHIYVKTLDRPSNLQEEHQWWQKIPQIPSDWPEQWINVNQWMIQETPCVFYDGGKKQPITYNGIYHNMYLQMYQQINPE